jgi:membrane dipeptidase
MLRSTLLLVALGTACAAPTAVRPAAGPVDPDRPVVQGPVVLGPEALRIARDLPVFDGHNDLPGELTLLVRQGFDGCDLREPQPQFHTDIPRLFQGGVGAQFWSVYVSASTEKTGDALERTLEQVDLVRRMVARYPDVFELASTADDVERIRGRRKIACMMGIEGGYSIENSLAHLRLFHALGVRYMTLTHSDTTAWADSSTDAPRHGGLSPFGEEVVREMNRLGMLVDVSHVSLETVDDALRVSQAPIIASHSSAFALAEHPRNLPDDRLRAIAANRGVVMVNFSSSFIHPESARKTQDMLQVMRELRARHPDEGEFRAAMGQWRDSLKLERGSVRDVCDHIEHIARVAGVDHVGLGSDFDGVPLLPEQLDDVAHYPYITQELLDRGWSEKDVRKVLGGNILRVLREAEHAARQT